MSLYCATTLDDARLASLWPLLLFANDRPTNTKRIEMEGIIFGQLSKFKSLLEALEWSQFYYLPTYLNRTLTKSSSVSEHRRRYGRFGKGSKPRVGPVNKPGTQSHSLASINSRVGTERNSNLVCLHSFINNERVVGRQR